MPTLQLLRALEALTSAPLRALPLRLPQAELGSNCKGKVAICREEKEGRVEQEEIILWSTDVAMR